MKLFKRAGLAVIDDDVNERLRNMQSRKYVELAAELETLVPADASFGRFRDSDRPVSADSIDAELAELLAARAKAQAKP